VVTRRLASPLVTPEPAQRSAAVEPTGRRGKKTIPPQKNSLSRNTSSTRKPVPEAESVLASQENIQVVLEENIRAITNQLVVGIVQADLSGRIVFANERYCEIIGYPFEELVGKNWQDLTHPGDLAHNVEVFEGMKHGGKPYTIEKRYLRKDGEPVWVEIGASLLRNRQNEVLGGIGIVVDITERKKTLDALNRSETRYRLLFENSRDALLTNTPNGKFVSANRSAVRMFGARNEAEFLALTPWDISPEFQPDGRSSAEKAREVAEITMREGSHFFEWMHKRLDGTTFPAEVMLTCIQVDCEVFIQGALRDITMRKKMEQEILERRNEMEYLQKQHIAAQTAAAIAHELNQPLLAIASYSEAALMLLQGDAPDLAKVRRAIEGSEQQAHRAGRSIRELLEFLSMKEFPSEHFDLNLEVLDAVNSAKSEHQLQFHSVMHLEKDLPPVRANRSHVRKVLHNLLHNSIEAMDEAGIELPAITVTVRTAKDENAAQVTIRDKGPGFRDENIHRLFEPFFTTKARGIGMGLAISRSLIEANGGQLWVDPEEKPGATFHLTLPLAQ
jgi:two-component system sensor kinase FixL